MGVELVIVNRKCKTHPQYKAMRAPQVCCEQCWWMYIEKRQRIQLQADERKRKRTHTCERLAKQGNRQTGWCYACWWYNEQVTARIKKAHGPACMCYVCDDAAQDLGRQ